MHKYSMKNMGYFLIAIIFIREKQIVRNKDRLIFPKEKVYTLINQENIMDSLRKVEPTKGENYLNSKSLYECEKYIYVGGFQAGKKAGIGKL